tara:strand:- start:435 stop:2867 length:2433 start_codon:yes stop_codon:yes gene_type:complete
MVKKLLYIVFFVFSVNCFAQELSIEGSIKDEKNQPIAFSNIILTSTSEASFVKGTTTNDQGVFKFEALKATTYILEVSFLGFETYHDTISLDKNISLSPIILKENIENLDGVTIIAKRPTVNRLVDRLVFNVENSTLSNNNVLDVLKNTPGVLVFDGAIKVKNSTPTVYINDRKVHLSSNEIQQLLEGTSANNVKSIEVITNPPAKYEAEGGSVLNIIMTKSLLPGYNGSVFGNYKQGQEYPKYSLGTSHFFKTETIDAYINYNISPRKDFRHNTEMVNFIENNQVVTSWDTDYKRTKESENQTINANIDFKVNNQNTLSLSTNILISPKKRTLTNVNSATEVFNSNSDLDSIFNTKINVADKQTNFAFNLDYTHKFKKEGEKLTIGGHLTNFDYLSDQFVDTDYFFADKTTLIRNNTFQTLSGQKTKLYTGQVDYELPISDSQQFEAGGKVSNINSESTLAQFNYVNGFPVLDLQNSNTFLYDEINYAGYVSYAKDWTSWSLKLGLRSEYTDITGNSIATNEINRSDYVKFFPSVNLLHTFNQKHDLYFNFNRRIYRPRYSELNPFKFYVNDNAYIEGNPNLKPQIDDQFTLGYSILKKYTFEAYYRYENNPTLEITFQDNQENIIKYINTNINSSISYGLDFITYTNVLPRWNLYVLSSLFYYDNKFFALASNNELVSNDKWSFYGQIINYFSFLKDKSLTADVVYVHISPIAEGATVASTRAGLNINLKKTFWNNKAALNLGVEDIFNTQNFTTSTKYLNQDVQLKSRMENRLFIVGFNYKFGNTHLKTNEKTIDLEERDRLNKKSN